MIAPSNDDGQQVKAARLARLRKIIERSAVEDEGPDGEKKRARLSRVVGRRAAELATSSSSWRDRFATLVGRGKS